MKAKLFLLIFFCTTAYLMGQQNEVSRSIKINKKYLNLPVQMSEERQQMSFSLGDDPVRKFVIRLSDGEPDYWVFSDVSEYMGQTLKLSFPTAVKGFDQIYQSDKWAGQDSVYQEVYRPQFHFTSQRGWNNDPNGLVYYDGTYHLFYQHNPYEILWENMHWGHATSTDLIHWTEVGEALYPDGLGTMFSGTAAIDVNNTTGFQTGEEPPMILAYTAHLNSTDEGVTQTQCIAYSNDKGQTFTKYSGNPVINSKETWDSQNTRDPKIFWHEPTEKWVMVLFEKDGHSFYNSDNLKDWTFQSHLRGFWECPELFELPIDGNQYNTQWVIYGASGTYMLGEFDGREFTPISGKHQYVQGRFFAAQTFNNIPETDGRRIQFGWGRDIVHPGMPFGQLMLFPTELSLRSTQNGVRLFNEPIQEIEQLYKTSQNWTQLTQAEANEKIQQIKSDLLRIKMKVEILDDTNFEVLFKGQTIARYDMNHNTINDHFYQTAQAESGVLELDILLDRTSVEVFVDKGAFTLVDVLQNPGSKEGLKINSPRGLIKIHHLGVHELKSIWNK